MINKILNIILTLILIIGCSTDNNIINYNNIKDATTYINNVSDVTADSSSFANANIDSGRNDSAPDVVKQKQFIVWPNGDSITMGAGSPELTGYRYELWQWFVSQGIDTHFVGTLSYGKYAEPLNDGHSGWAMTSTSYLIKATLGPELVIPHADLVVILIGTNDMGMGNVNYANPDLWNRYYNQILAAMDQADPTTWILVSTITPVNPIKYPVPAANVDLFNASQIAWWDAYDLYHPKHKLIRADANKAIGKYSKDNFYDDAHPNPAGYTKIVKEFIRVILASKILN